LSHTSIPVHLDRQLRLYLLSGCPYKPYRHAIQAVEKELTFSLGLFLVHARRQDAVVVKVIEVLRLVWCHTDF